MTILSKFTEQKRKDILSGITVALALVPEAVAFAFVAGVDPLVGLYAAFMVGLITSVFGGRPGMISGATGALAIIMVDFVQDGNKMALAWEHPMEGGGLFYLFGAVILMGVIQMLCGVLKLGKFVRLIPHSVMMGFVNGLAIVIFMAQISMFTETVGGKEQYLEGGSLYMMLGLVALTMFIIWGLPKITKALPSGLIAILVITGIVIFGNLDVATVGSFIKDGGGTGLKGGLPIFQADLFSKLPFNMETLKFILPTALLLAAVGLVESLMTLNLVDEITETRGDGNRECLAQGAANIVTGLFGGMGGCAMIGQSIINIQNGGRGRLSGIIAALALLAFILFGSLYIEMIPIAALVGIMFMVVIGTFAWSTFRVINKIPKSDALVIILVVVVTVIEDLALGVAAGVIVSSLVFAWNSAKRIRARKMFKEDGTKIYEIWGPLFFGSISVFNSKFDVKGDPEKVEIDFIESKIADHSGIEAIFNLAERYKNAGKSVQLKHLSDDCKRLLLKASPELASIIIDDIDDPRYYVVTDIMEDTKA